MSEVVTLELPADLIRQARSLAAATNRRLDDVVADGIGRAVADPPVETLPDDQVRSLCDLTLPDADQHDLSALLADSREGRLTPADRPRLDALLDTYRRGLALKARAVKEAVARGLIPRLDADAA